MADNKHNLTIRQPSGMTLRKTADLMALTRNLLAGRNALVSEESLNLWLQELWDWADHNNISDDYLPRDKEQLIELTEVNLGKNYFLTFLPESLGNLTQLTTLDLCLNSLTSLPESLGNLTQLTTLDLSYNPLTSLPESLGNLIQLTTLNLSGNRLAPLPKSLGNLTQLTTLDLSGGCSTSLPEWLGNLTQLTTLDLSGSYNDWNGWERSELTSLPEWLGNLTQLTELNLYGYHGKIPHALLNKSNLRIYK